MKVILCLFLFVGVAFSDNDNWNNFLDMGLDDLNADLIAKHKDVVELPDFQKSMDTKYLGIGFHLSAEVMSSDKKARSVKIEDLLSTAKNVEKGEDKTMIIDVREVHEIQETGIIPGGVNIPLGTVEAAMAMDPEAFKDKYGKEKPDTDTKIILSCRSGKRSLNAYSRLEKLGFKNLYNYEGGWLGYEEYIKNQKS